MLCANELGQYGKGQYFGCYKTGRKLQQSFLAMDECILVVSDELSLLKKTKGGND